jgi:hypothetical protein
LLERRVEGDLFVVEEREVGGGDAEQLCARFAARGEQIGVADDVDARVRCLFADRRERTRQFATNRLNLLADLVDAARGVGGSARREVLAGGVVDALLIRPMPEQRQGGRGRQGADLRRVRAVIGGLRLRQISDGCARTAHVVQPSRTGLQPLGDQARVVRV